MAAGVGTLVATIIWPGWFEKLFGLGGDIDGGNGLVEWALSVVVVLAAMDLAGRHLIAKKRP